MFFGTLKKEKVMRIAVVLLISLLMLGCDADSSYGNWSIEGKVVKVEPSGERTLVTLEDGRTFNCRLSSNVITVGKVNRFVFYYENQNYVKSVQVIE